MTAADQLAKRLTWIYDRARSAKAADAAAADPAGALADLAGHKYCLLVTYRTNGKPIPTPLWFGIGDGKLFVQTGATDGKVKRIGRNPTARVAPCTARGRPP